MNDLYTHGNLIFDQKRQLTILRPKNFTGGNLVNPEKTYIPDKQVEKYYGKKPHVQRCCRCYGSGLANPLLIGILDPDPYLIQGITVIPEEKLNIPSYFMTIVYGTFRTTYSFNRHKNVQVVSRIRLDT